MLNETRRQTSILERIAKSVARQTSGPVELTYALG
jgi:hypothetical protein